MTPTSNTPTSSSNRILSALPEEEYAVLAPHLERITLELKTLAFDIDQPIEHLYFPEGSVFSVLGVMADGTAVETATIGKEGIVGLPVFLGTDRATAQAVVQVSGPSQRMPADAFRAAVAKLPTLTLLLHRYTQALFTLVAQSSACNRIHTMEQRCARWLLHTHDRVEHDEFPLTHQFLSQMLGVRRATVTEAMGALQAAGAITYEMGRVRVVDRARLEDRACECYWIIVREFDRLLADPRSEAPRIPSPLANVRTSERGRSVVGDGAPSGAGDAATADEDVP